MVGKLSTLGCTDKGPVSTLDINKCIYLRIRYPYRLIHRPESPPQQVSCVVFDCVQCGAQEDACVQELVRTDNKVLNKVVLALGTLCVEVKELEREAQSRFFPALLLYGEGSRLLTAAAFSFTLPCTLRLSCTLLLKLLSLREQKINSQKYSRE